MKQGKLLALLWVFLACIVPFSAWSAVPQQIGMPDLVSTNYTAAACSSCHAGSSSTMAQHHLKNIPRGTRVCTECHAETVDPVTLETRNLFTADCVACHASAENHHKADAQINCRSCHGSVVDDYNDDHYIPSYPPGETTPLVFSSSRSCNSCHSAAAPNDPMPINNPTYTHHAILGPSYLTVPCSTCHQTPDFSASTAVRVCERCHGINSLHNIQAYTGSDPQGAVTFMGETAGKGHVGEAADCRGCHTNDMPALTVDIGTVVPYVTGLSKVVVKEETATALTVIGNGFMSRDASGAVSAAPQIVISGPQNLVLSPSVSGNALETTLPALPSGTYSLIVTKGDKVSNKRVLTVAPSAAISAVTLSNGQFTITGTGFGASDPLLLQRGPVTVNNIPCTVVSWSDTAITAVAPNPLPASALISVRTLFDTATFVKDTHLAIISATSYRGAITIRGSLFGDVAGSVTVDGGPCSIISWSDTLITAMPYYNDGNPSTVTVDCAAGSVSAPLVVWGAMPQQIGTPDQVPDNYSAATCTACHAGDSGTMAQHHLLSAPAGTKLCADCHVETVDPVTLETGNLFTADCLTCHVTTENHHKANASINCRTCHGSVVDDYNDGHYIPSYPPNVTTPLIFSSTGSCRSCHSPSPYDEVPISNLANTHHAILGPLYDAITCNTCHQGPNFNGSDAIRTCEHCHGINSLHSIQAYTGTDPAGAGVTFMGETAGKGHVGNAADCRGCHTNDMPLPEGIGTVVPFVSALSAVVLKEGVATELSVYGNGFMSSNAAGTPSPTPQIAISGSQSHVLTPTVSGDILSVTIPALPAGTYGLTVTKGDKISNRRVLTVAPSAAISAVTLSEGTFTVAGTGFGASDPLLLQRGPVTLNNVPCTVISWSNTAITAVLPAPIATTSLVAVKTLFGITTFVKEPPPVMTEAEWVRGTVTITGTGFGFGDATDSVMVNGAPCTIVAWSDTFITATTATDPAAGSTVSVSCSAGSVSGPLTVRNIELTSAEWISGTLTVSGRGFGDGSDPDNSIMINGTPCSIIGWTDSTITAAVAVKPPIVSLVTVSAAWGDASAPVAVRFVTVDSAEWIKGTLTVKGSGFGVAGASANRVTVNGTAYTVLFWNDSLISVSVPIQPTQPASTTIAAAWGTATAPVAVRSVAVSSAEWIKGTLTVTGSGFGTSGAPDNRLLVNGVACTPTSWTNSTITATVAEPAANATVTVLAAWGTASSSIEVRKATIVAAEWLLGKVTVTGTGFGTAGNAANTLKINGALCTVTSWSDTVITASVATAPPAVSTVQVTAAYGSASAPLVVKTVIINSATWTKGSITITGSGFGTAGYTGNRVYMNTTLCTIVSWSNTTIVATYKNTPPNGATAKVQAAYGTATALLKRK